MAAISYMSIVQMAQETVSGTKVLAFNITKAYLTHHVIRLALPAIGVTRPIA
jgi:hypothetical protein